MRRAFLFLMAAMGCALASTTAPAADGPAKIKVLLIGGDDAIGTFPTE